MGQRCEKCLGLDDEEPVPRIYNQGHRPSVRAVELTSQVTRRQSVPLAAAPSYGGGVQPYAGAPAPVVAYTSSHGRALASQPSGFTCSSVSGPLGGRRASLHASSLRRINTLHRRRTTIEGAALSGSQLQRFRDEYTIQKRLAAGAFGVTYLAVERESGRSVVVKRPNDSSDTSDFERLCDKTSPYIVRTFEIFSDGYETYVVMEYCAGGNLFNALWSLFEREGYVSTTWCAKIFKQVLQGLHYLHEQFQVSHNDIKPENILLEHSPAGGHDAPRTMIGDFGCASGRGERAQAGDPRYLAPEILAKRQQPRGANGVHIGAADMWSSGVTLFEMLTGLLPFINHHNISGWEAFRTFQSGRLEKELKVKHGMMLSGALREPDCSMIMDQQAQQLVRMSMQVDPAVRINVGTALRSPWLELANLGQQRYVAGGPGFLDVAVCRAHAKNALDLKLREVVLVLVTSKLQGEHVAFYQQAWDKWDGNDDGVLDRNEFLRLYASLNYPTGLMPADAGAIFDVLDVDSNGTIDFGEFVAFMFDPKRLPMDVRRMYFLSAFSTLKGTDGMVRQQDVENLFSQDARGLIKRLFDEMDADRSGSIDFDEFSAYVMRLCEP